MLANPEERFTRAGLHILMLLGTLLVTLMPVAAAEATRAVSATDRICVSGAGGSFTPSFSTDGRCVVFVSQANNLVTNDDHSLNLDVFVRDRVAATTTLVSVNTSGTGGGNADANHPTISSNGQFVAFESRAPNLVAGDTNGFTDIFVRDLAGGTTRPVSVAADGVSGANGPSWNAMISGDGRRVFFESRASNLVAQATVGTNIFVRDLWSNTTALVTVSADGLSGGNAPAELRQVSDDGRFALWVSGASNLALPFRTNLQVYLRDMESQVTWCVSGSTPTPPASPGPRANAVMTPDARRVCYHFNVQTMMTAVTLWERTNNTTITCADFADPVDGTIDISADGRKVVMQASGQIRLWHAVNMAITQLLSVGTNGAGASSTARRPLISKNGNWVTFVSGAVNLVSNLMTGGEQLFARDLGSGTTRLVSVSTNDASLGDDLGIFVPAMDDAGQQISFETAAADAVDGDVNAANDVFLYDLNAGTTELVSAALPARVARTGVALCSITPSALSADARYVLSFSKDNLLFPPPTNWMCSLFLTDLTGGATLPILTAATDAANPTQLAPDALSRAADTALSADGRYAALVRRSWNGLSYSADQMIRFDRLTGLQSVVSLSAGTHPIPAGTGHTAPDLSADGRLIVWQCRAANLVAQPPVVNSSFNAVFLRDMQAGTNQLISLNLAGNNTGNSESINPRLSPDTRRVVFQSRAMDVTPGAGNTVFYKLFARDLPAQTTRLVSVDEAGATIESESSGGLAFSGDGRYAAFHTTNTARIFRHEFASDAGTNLLVAANGMNPSMSFDGRFVAYETRRGGANTNDVFVKDLQSGAEELISVNRADAGGGDASSFAPAISAYGRYVVFASKAGNLVDNDTNGFTDIFVRDRWATNTLLVSVNRAGVAGNAVSSHPLLAADGRTVVFESFSSDLVDGDFNDKRDVFVLKLGSADTDGDGMDDDWEVAFFGTLARDGVEDLDGEGVSDLQEFRAGTDPTNLGSVLRVFTLASSGGGPTTLLWSAVPGRSYRVQFKDSLDAVEWNEHPSVVVAQFSTASFIDTNAPSGGQRFYRVTTP